MTTHGTKIKICGLTNRTDARIALESGADYLGFIFARASRRFVEPDTVREITGSLPKAARTVGVFVNCPPTRIREIVDHCQLKVIQLHGDEGDATIRGLAQFAEVWKTVWLSNSQDLAEAANCPATALVVDTVHDGQRGGTGQVGDWSLAAALACRRRIILAGGLNPDNLARAVLRVQPFAVDVSSGVESQAGSKDHDKIRAFCSALPCPSGPAGQRIKPLHRGDSGKN